VPRPTTVHVALSERSYDIHIGAGLLAEAGRAVGQWCDPTRVAIITDTNVEHPHAQTVAEQIAGEGVEVDILVVEAGETSKSVECAQQIWEELLRLGADRKTVITAVGGGVVGDLGGFIAATYGRGVPFLQVPTTLLSQVDSSVGGKVGINLPGAKNIVGAFWQPAGVLIDPHVLTTLPDREYRSGLAEVVKYGVILDADFFTYLEEHVAELARRDADVLRQTIARCCQLKADVVVADERETTGLRAVLNYGHTFCHAIEAVTEYGRFLHGEAVAIGMTCAARLAISLSRVDEAFLDRQSALLAALDLPLNVPEDLDRDALMQAMARDKKAEHGRLRFVLPTRLGHVELVADVPEDKARAAWEGGT